MIVTTKYVSRILTEITKGPKLPVDLVKQLVDEEGNHEMMEEVINHSVMKLIDANIIRYDVEGKVTLHSKVERFKFGKRAANEDWNRNNVAKLVVICLLAIIDN